MAKVRHAAVIDIGKTNAKVTLVRTEDAAELAHRTAANRVPDDGPYPHFDVGALWEFICGALSSLNREAPLDAISVTAHGSAGAFIGGESDNDDGGLALPILDYEFAGPDELTAEYDDVRPDFSESLSPRLPLGLNLGAQIFWQQKRFPKAVGRAEAYVTYPQYWAWRLSGVAATEMCSIGAHSDLWDPRALTWSSLVKRMSWEELFAPLRPAADVLGPVRPALAERLGLGPEVKVFCGIHDSSASLLPHVIARTPPFTVVSTGTWTILFAVGGDLDRLDPGRDTLANVTPFGDPVPCARFMGGREFEILAGAEATPPTAQELARVVDEQVMALPSFVPGVGPLPDRQGSWSHDPKSLSPGERNAAASLYLALMTQELMLCTGAAGPVIVDGPFAANPVYCGALAAIAQADVCPSAGLGGTTLGAIALLDPGRAVRPANTPAIAPLSLEELESYARSWRGSIGCSQRDI
jgi:sugar (pentulose or hexulose) kinase